MHTPVFSISIKEEEQHERQTKKATTGREYKLEHTFNIKTTTVAVDDNKQV